MSRNGTELWRQTVEIEEEDEEVYQQCSEFHQYILIYVKLHQSAISDTQPSTNGKQIEFKMILKNCE